MGTITRLDAINRGFRQQSGMDRHDLDCEEESAKIFFSALDRFVADCKRAAELSELRGRQILETMDAVQDFAPGKSTWWHAIDAARRGE